MKNNYNPNKITLNDLDVNNSIDISQFINNINTENNIYYNFINDRYNNFNDLFNNYLFEILDDNLITNYIPNVMSVNSNEFKFTNFCIQFEEKLEYKLKKQYSGISNARIIIDFK